MTGNLASARLARQVAWLHLLGALAMAAWAAPAWAQWTSPQDRAASAQVQNDPDLADEWAREISRLDDGCLRDPPGTAQKLADLIERMPRSHGQRWRALLARAYCLSQTSDAGQDAPFLAMAAQLNDQARSRPELAAAPDLVLAIQAMATGASLKAKELAVASQRRLSQRSPLHLQFLTLSTAGAIHTLRGEHADAVRARRQQLAVAERMGSEELISALLALATPLVHTDQFDAARPLIERAKALAESSQYHSALIHVHILLAMSDAPDNSNPPLTAQHMRAALLHARATGSPRMLANQLGNLAGSLNALGQYQEALALTQEGLALNEPRDTEVLQYCQGLALIGLQQLEPGLRIARAGIEAAQQAGDARYAEQLALDLAQFLERLGHSRLAVQAYGHYRRVNSEAALQAERLAVQGLQEDHEAGQRAATLDLLSRDNQLQQALLAEQTITTRAWAAGTGILGLLVLAGGALLHRQRRSALALAQANDRLHRLATEDLLTGLPNRRQITERLTGPQGPALLAGAGLLLIDLDHFKQVNDSLGHARGDQVLMQTAQRLRSALGPRDVLARWGGEEFLVVSPQASGAALTQLAHRLLQSLRQAPLQVNGHSLPITASIGMARLPDEPAAGWHGFDDGLEQADQALYEAKAAGRNQAHWATDAAWGVAGLDPLAMPGLAKG